MNFLRNFFYNTSDIIIAAVIVLVSAVVIWTRIDAIMSYSSEIGDIDQATVSEDYDNGGDDATPEEVIHDNDIDIDEDDDVTTTTTDDEDSDGVEDGSIVNFKVKGGQSTDEIAQNLVDAGLIGDKSAFLKDCADTGADKKLRSGEFKIKKGISHSEIIAILTKS